MSRPIFSYYLLLVFLLIGNTLNAQNDSLRIPFQYKLVKPTSKIISNFSGDNQTQTVGLKSEKPIRILVLDENNTPSKNKLVKLNIISVPSGDVEFKILDTLIYTDSAGIAQTFIVLGLKEGLYEISAQLVDYPESNFLIYKANARKSNWVFLLVIGLIGGLGLFLLGMNMMSDGMQNAAGDKMRGVLSHITNNRFIAIGVGTFVTMVIQSSSATTVMLVSFVYSKLMKFRQTIGIILGAGIGTTITAQLIAFKLTDYSLLLVGVGFIMNSFTKSSYIRSIGKTILGFGILFFGMHIMSESMFPLRSFAPFIDSIVKLENPLLGILIGAIFTALIQSSSAFIGIMIVLAMQGLISLEASIPLLFGANIGTAITAILASIKTDREAKQVALAHTLIKIIGVLLFLFWIPQLAEIVKIISPKSTLPDGDLNSLAATVPRQIANAHTVFNVVLTCLILPFINVFGKFVEKLLPVKYLEEPVLRTVYLDYGMVKNASLALSLAKKETLRMGKLVQNMTGDIIIPYLVKKTEIIEDIKSKEEEVNFLRDQINDYILKITRENLNEERVNESFQLLYTVKEFEQIADIVSTTMIAKAERWSKMNYKFSIEGKNEIVNYHTKTQKQLSRALEVLENVNLEKAKAMKEKYRHYRNMEIELEKHHFERLKDEIVESVSSSKTHIELMTFLRAINGHATNIARILIKWTDKG
ncbi:MAG: Na/Pi cotransporter family protein [Bacteroidales bacterium]|jgi:phosphate:Na+ symporter|nr:Na/Pi cotransporter family protein [Bacteroidales bacterium]